VTHEAGIGVLLAELHFPASRSLKDKRAPLASLRDALQHRFRVSFSEVGLQDVWQRAHVLVVLGSSSLAQAAQRLDEVDRYLHGQDFDVARVLLKSVDPVDALWDFDA
jgi:uncharacterized protein YlxP (DUF503 family)